MRLGLAALLLVASAGSAGTVADLDAKNGFRDAKFGAPIESFQGMVPIDALESGALMTYTRSTDELSLGDVTLTEVSYCFYKGLLYSVTLKTDIVGDGPLLRTLQAGYGEGKKVSARAEEYYWFGKKVVLVYERNPKTGEGSAEFKSEPLSNQILSGSEAAAKKAANDL